MWFEIDFVNRMSHSLVGLANVLVLGCALRRSSALNSVVFFFTVVSGKHPSN